MCAIYRTVTCCVGWLWFGVSIFMSSRWSFSSSSILGSVNKNNLKRIKTFRASTRSRGTVLMSQKLRVRFSRLGFPDYYNSPSLLSTVSVREARRFFVLQHTSTVLLLLLYTVVGDVVSIMCTDRRVKTTHNKREKSPCHCN